MSSPAPVATSPKVDITKVAKVEESKAPTSPPATATTPSASAALAEPVAASSPITAAASPAPAPAAKEDETKQKGGGKEEAATPAAPTAAEEEEEVEVEDEGPVPTDPEGIINMEIFGQIQDMDDDDDDDAGGHEFSKGIVWGYFEQAEQTFKQMEEAIAEPSLWKLSSLGHFLKGSSAALGIIRVQNSCEQMQHYGNLRDEEVGAALSEDEALRRIKELLKNCKRDYAVASRYLRQLYASYEE